MQRRCKQTSVEERTRFVNMWVDGMSLRAIAHITGTSVSTVFRWIHRWLWQGNGDAKLYVRKLLCHKRKIYDGTLRKKKLKRSAITVDSGHSQNVNYGPTAHPQSIPWGHICQNEYIFSAQLGLLAAIQNYRLAEKFPTFPQSPRNYSDSRNLMICPIPLEAQFTNDNVFAGI